MQTAHGTFRGGIWVGERPVAADGLLLRRVSSGYLLTRDRQLAEEILQDALVAVWRGAYAGRSSAKTRIFGVCRRRAHNTLRRRNLSPADEDPSDALPAPDPGPEDILLTGGRRRELADRMGGLSSLHREALVLVFFQVLSYEETAEVA